MTVREKPRQPPLVVHLIYRLDVGGLESLMVDCINGMPPGAYRHAVVCLCGYSDFATRITRPGVDIHSLDKPPGLGLGAHVRLWRLLRKLRPAILHTYNLPAVEYQLTAAMAGVPVRVHAEHGRDARDPQGLNPRHRLLRRLLTPFIDRWVPVSNELDRWLRSQIGVPEQKVQLINNGVDVVRYQPESRCELPRDWPFRHEDFVIGTVGRATEVKHQASLIHAYLILRTMMPAQSRQLKLAIIGDGPLLDELREQAATAGISDSVWLPGARHDISAIMPRLSVFCLPSIAEGTPVTMLEAMAAGLPVVASRVGGIPALVQDGVNGTLVEARNSAGFAMAIAAYARQPQLAWRHGMAARQRIEQHYSHSAMLHAYRALYDSLCQSKHLDEAVTSCAE
jgi:sugar transferase (PEP-CTERM/EpsH1 system associated)